MTDQAPGGRMRELAAVAMMGSDRAGAAAGGGGAGAVALLRRAATLGARGRAGYIPRVIASRLAESPSDARPLASAGALATLARLLSEPEGVLIEEWAAHAQAAGVRVDDATVPVLLDWWSRQPQRSSVVFALLGDHGAWLAAFNDSWRKPVVTDAIPANTDDLWQTGTTPERVALIATVRAGDPARALSLIQSTWKADSADARRKFVEQLSIGLTMADEPFLESVLDDRSKLAREAAAHLLSRLPESRLVARMTALVRGIFTIEPAKRGLIKKTAAKVTVEPPAEYDEAWERDAIEEKPPGGVGKRAWWLQQIVARTPPSALIGLEFVTPAEFLAGIEETDYAKDVVAPLSVSCATSGNPEWCIPLAFHRLDRKSSHAIELAPLWQALAPERREEAVLELVKHDKLTWSERWAMLGSCEHPWSTAFSSRACAILKANVPSKPPDWYQISPQVDAISRHLDPGSLSDFEVAVTALFRDQVWPSITKSLDRVRLRADMRKEFSP